MRRLACYVAMFAFALVHSPAAPNSRHVNAAVQADTAPLAFDTPASGSLLPRQNNMCSVTQPQYTLQYPGGATRVKIEISVASPQTAGSLSLYVRFGERVVVEPTRITADFATAATMPLYFPTNGLHVFEAGTYYIALTNCGSEQVDYTIRAKLLTPTDADTAEVTVETSFGEVPAAPPGSCSLSRTQYKVITPNAGPCSGNTIGVTAFSNQNIKLYARRDQRVTIENGQIVADIASPSAGTFLTLLLLPGGTYFIAVVNCSTEAADYVVSLSQVVVDADLPLVNGCSLERNPSGKFVLNVYGVNIREGAMVTVGGVTPKKVKFVELEPGATNFYRTIRLVKRFCGSLPGNIVITNPPGSCTASSAFFCNQACPN
jgi:hypothetical protein